MFKAKLFSATAAVALLTGSAAFAQDAMTPATPTEAPAAQAEQSTPAAVAPAAPAATQTAEAATPATAGTVIDVLQADGNFTTLLAALDKAQLTETLRTRPAISIFAPTDAAFAALPEADRTRLMDPANVNDLRQLLLYHVVVADVSSDQLEGAKGGVETAARSEVQIDGTGDAIKVDDATVTQADLDASNGAVFAIDQVLSPATSQAAMGDMEAAEPAEPAAPAEPVAPAATAPAAAPMTAPAPVEPAAPVTAPNGQPAASTETIASPPVVNPTDGQMDDPARTTPSPLPADEADATDPVPPTA